MATVYGKILGKKTFNIDIGISRLKTLPKNFLIRKFQYFKFNEKDICIN